MQPVSNLREAPPPTGSAERPLGVVATFGTVALTFVAGQLIGGAALVVAAIVAGLLGHGSLASAVRSDTDSLMSHPIFVCLAAATAGGTLVFSTFVSLRVARVPFRA